MEKLVLMNLKEFVEETASDSPAPGGGSVAALAGALSAALANMVFNLSKGKKKYEALDEDIRKKMEKEFENLSKLSNEMLFLIDEDTEAFNMFMAALKMPKETEEEKAKRKKEMAVAAEASLKVPMRTAEASLEILRNLETISRHGNKNAISDCGVATELARSAFRGARLNVKINLPSIQEESLIECSKNKIAKLEKECEELYLLISGIVEESLS